MHNINTALCFDSNNKAKLKLRVITLLEKSGWQAVSIAFPGISRATVYRWRKRYMDSDKKLQSLIPKSTKPHKTREMIVPAKVLKFIKELRIKYPRLSKYKIKPYLDIFCEEQRLPTYSVSWIGKVIKRYSFFFKTRKPVRRKRRTQKVKRIKYCPRQKNIKLGYLQLDGIHVVFEGRIYYFISAIELKSRQAWAKRVKSLSSKQAKLFLQEILEQVNYPVHTIQTDNGSEFKGYFNQAIDQLKNTTHLFSYPRKPKTNGYVERFNWTVQDEFINYEIDLAENYPQEFDNKLEEWLEFYNTKRPHQSLGYKTPIQAVQLFTS
jgi:hypothetical protein